MWAAVFISALVQQEPATKEYRDNDLGLIFQYPQEWRLTKTRLGAQFEFLTEEGATARVTITRTPFREAKDQWQSYQRDIEEAARREVLDQSEEELLGVPLLLTRTRYTGPDGIFRQLKGLLYSRSRQKLNFILEAPETAFPGAETAWRGTWNSFRTITGELPVAEGTPETTNPTNPTQDAEREVYTLTDPKDDQTAAEATRRPETRVEVPGPSGTETIALPEGWTAEPRDAVIVLRHPSVQGTTVLTLSLGDTAFARRVMNNLNRDALKRFDVVSLRKEETIAENQNGAQVMSVLREGTTPGGSLVLLSAVGGQSFGVWSLLYETTDSLKYGEDKAQIEALLAVLARIRS